MLDFVTIAKRIVKDKETKENRLEIYPKFICKQSQDLMIQGGKFYAIWDDTNKVWSTDEQTAVHLIDHEIENYISKHNLNTGDVHLSVKYLWDADTGMIDKWHKFCEKQLWDMYVPLDEHLIFADKELKRSDYATKKLPYILKEGPYDAYEKLISTLYSTEERHKIEWTIGAVINGASKTLQKFVVLYGSAGTGKSTILNIIEKLFDGYTGTFNAKALGQANNGFALEALKSNPLVAIEHDSDLSGIQDNTRLNSLVSHETMTINEKFKSAYSNSFKSFLFLGTNKPVRITDARSGLLRRLIDITPSGDKVPKHEYLKLIKQIDFELGAIAWHCKQVYEEDPNYYDDYIPRAMWSATNDFYNYILENYDEFEKENGTTLKGAWELYKTYCVEANVYQKLSQKIFREELRNYFAEYKERHVLDDGTRVRSYFLSFKKELFEEKIKEKNLLVENGWLQLKNLTFSTFDILAATYTAQYAKANGTPSKKWSNVKTSLSDLDTSKLHYILLPINHIVIDFDLKDASGNKNLQMNIEAASQFPPTYAEVSQGGQGLHLHYIYEGDPESLSRVYQDGIEVKVFTGESSLRRKLTLCNTLKVASINSGLPLRKVDKKLINEKSIYNEKALRTLIWQCLTKQNMPGTIVNMTFLEKLLNEMYESGKTYDVTDLQSDIFLFASNSTHHDAECLEIAERLKLKSESDVQTKAENDEDLIFYDVEVYPNLFVVCWKKMGAPQIQSWINPSGEEIEELLRYKLVGFNCRRYDNHILHGRILGKNNEQLYHQSAAIISGKKDAMYGSAYNYSYTDVYDFSSKKQSLKKFEIELDIFHKEMEIPWDQPVPEDRWLDVIEYCKNDVIATEEVFKARKADWEARKVLAKIAGGTVNDTTNSLTTRLIFGTNKFPQSEFIYTDLSKDFPGYKFDFAEVYDEDTGKKKVSRVSTYRGELVGEGGYVYAEPGIYENVALLDIASMHPSTIKALNLFGDRYTKIFWDLVEARLFVKHKDFDHLDKLFNGSFKEFRHASDEELDNLSKALKIVINSVYGLTAAKFPNAFRDPRNIDNIVAKRGALFMVNLKHEVQERGFTVAHIKTDSIKIPNATPEIIQFVTDYGKQYGYSFEHEATYEKMCLVNDAVYIAKYADGKHAGEWTATGTQFAVPYVYKTCFSREPIEFNDLCETKAVDTALYLDMNEGCPDVSEYEALKEARKAKKKTKKQERMIFENEYLSDEELDEKIAQGHNLHFVGKVGRFCPMISGVGAGTLLRKDKNAEKYNAATGSKGYKWMESDMVKMNQLEDKIDRDYYRKLVDDAIDEISKYGDFEAFRA